MNLPVNVFETVFDASGVVIQSHYEAAEHMLRVCVDNQLESFIKTALENSPAFKALRSSMPSKTPESISDYQKNLKRCDIHSVAEEIDDNGIILTEGTCLYHGGFWNPSWGCKTELVKPLSTSFCPQVALRNAEWAGKAYDSGEVNLFVLNVSSPSTKAFIFRNRGTNLGHEKEVLFSSGASLILRSKTKIRDDYNVSKVVNGSQVLHKKVPAYVLEIDIS